MGVVENMKEVADIIKKLGDIELNRKILTLETEVLDLTREKRRAEERAEELERTLNLRANLVFDPPFYWLEGDQTPFCPSCWEDRHKAVHVVLVFDNPPYARLDCPVCKHEYGMTSVRWYNVSSRRQPNR